MDLSHRCRTGLHRRAAGVVQRTDAFDRRVVLRGSDPVVAQRRAGRLVGVDRVGLAQTAPLGAFRPNDLDDDEALGRCGRGDADTVGGGAFDPDRDRITVAGDERQRPSIARRSCGELLVGQVVPAAADHGHVDGILVGVDPAIDLPGIFFDCHAGCAFHSMEVGSSRVGRQDSNEALARLL